MTKKFWADWQRRVGETQNIHLFAKVFNGDGSFAYYGKRVGGIWYPSLGDHFLKATFHGDAVDIIYEICRQTSRDTFYRKNVYITLHRQDISSVTFK